MDKYEVVSNHGAGLFENKQDALLCLQMLGDYHGLAINRTAAEKELDKTGFFECWPLNIRKVTD